MTNPIINLKDVNRSTKSWIWICESLSSKNHYGECRANILDTVLIENGDIYGWYFTGKNGKVLKKMEKNVRMQHITSHFAKVGSAYDRNESTNYIAVLWTSVGYNSFNGCSILTQEELQTNIETLPKGVSCILHAFVQPRGQLDADQFGNFEYEYKLGSDNRCQGKGTKILGSQRIPSMETQVNKAMHDIISSIVQTTEKVRKCRIVNFKGLFVVDDFNRVYLCKSLHCETLPLPKPSRSIKASLSMPLIDNNNDVLEQPQQNDGNHVPSASTQRAVEREKRAAALVNEDEVDRILQRNHYSKKHAKAKHHHQSPMEYKIDSIDISAAKECVHSRRVATAAHLGSSQLNGCCGDFCSREFDIGDYAKESRYRNISKSTPGSSSSGSSSSAFNDRLRAMDQLLPPLDEKNQKSTPASTVSRQGSSTNLDHKISFKYIAQARIEKEYVEMYLRRYQSKEVCDYLTEELYASSQTVSESFPGHYYREVEICHNCFNVYSLIEEARAKSSHKIAMRKKAQQQQKHHQLETPPVSSAFRRKDQERVGSSGSSVEWNIAKTHLDVLVKHDFAELRSFTHPPPAVVMVTVLLIELVTGQRLDSWAEAKKNISRENFVSIVQAFHIDMLKSEQVIQLYPYLENEHFRPQIIEPISICAANICRWIFAVLRAYGVAFGHNLADPAIVSFLLSLPIKKSDEHLPLMIPNAPSQDQSLKTTIVTKHFKTPKNAGASKSKVLSNTTKRKEMKARQKIQKEHMDRLSLPQSIHTIQDQESEFPNIFTTSDGQTSLPYTIIGQSDYRISKPDLVVFHDIFDTCDATAIFFRNVVTKHLGTKALFFNYPGQAGTSWGKSTKQDVDTTNDQPSIATLNNQFIAECVHELFQHLIQTGEFALDALPFVIIGFGFGANIASCFSILYQKYYRSTFKQLFLLNGFAAVDTTLAAILHSTISVFSCFPVTRPDLPISYFTKFLFSERYLEKVDPNLVLNLYTAVSNSITLNGRIQLCKGALHHVDVSSRLPEIQVPLIVFQSVDNNLIQPSSVDPFFRGRQCTHIWSHQHQEASAGLSDKTKAQLQSIILPQEQTSGTSSSQPPAFVIWLKAGHELRQEGKRQILDVLDAILGETIIPTNDLPEAITSSTTLEKPVASLSTSSIQKKTLSRKIDILPLSSLRTNLQPVKPTEDLPKKEDRDDNKESSTEIAMTVVATTEMDQTERAFQQALEQHRQQKCQDLERKKNHPIVKPTSKPQPAFPERRTIIHPPVASTTSGSGSSATRVESEIQKIHVKIKQQEQRHEKERMKKGIHNQQIVDDQLTTLRREQDQRRERWQDEDDARIAALNAELYGYDVERQNTSANVLADLDAEEHQTYDDMNHEIKTTKPVELPDRPRSPSDLDFPQNPVLNPDLNPVVLTRDEHKVLTQASAAPRSSGRSAAAPSQDQKSNSPQLPKVEKHEPKVEKHKPKVENKTQEPEIITPLTSEEFQLVKREVHVANKERERRHADLSAKELLALRQTKATVIQSIARMNLAKTTIRLRREALARAQLEAFAGELVTRVARGYLGRRLTQMLRVIRSRHEEYTKASLNVQRVFRGHVVRNQVLEIKSEAKSVEIQRVFRGHVGRSRARVARGARETLLHQHALATKIQSSWRMRVARDDYLEQRAFSFAALEIQRVFRGHVARKKVRRQREWLGAEPGPERLELGLSLISASKEAFEHQRQDIDALHRAQELAEARVSEIHLDLRESEKELGVLEHELAELDQIEKDLQELTNEQEMLANEGAQEDTVPLGSGVLSSSSSFMAAQGSSHALNVVHTPDTYGFESKEAMRKRQAEKYAVEMAIHLKKSEREQKKKDLEAEFTNVFQDVERKRVALGEMEGKIAEMEITRLRKDREFARLQRNLMELVEEQKYELEQVREKGIELETAVATSAAAASAAAEKQLANQERSNAMYQSTEELIKFQFMSMSLTYMSSLNMVKSLRDLDADTSKSAVASAASTAATAAAAASAANIPDLSRVPQGLPGAEPLQSKKKKRELALKKIAEDQAKEALAAPFPVELRDWTVADVGRWLETLSLKQYAPAFREAAIDGAFLIELRPEDMTDILGMSHKLHVRKVVVARNALLPLSMQEQMAKDVVTSESAAKDRRGGVPDLEVVFSQARNGRLKRLEESLEAGFDINTEDEKGNTLLIIACQNVNRALVEMLVLKRADVSHQNGVGNTPLHFAMAYDTDGSLGEYLIGHGADDSLENEYGMSPYDGISQ